MRNSIIYNISMQCAGKVAMENLLRTEHLHLEIEINNCKSSIEGDDNVSKWLVKPLLKAGQGLEQSLFFKTMSTKRTAYVAHDSFLFICMGQ